MLHFLLEGEIILYHRVIALWRFLRESNPIFGEANAGMADTAYKRIACASTAGLYEIPTKVCHPCINQSIIEVIFNSTLILDAFDRSHRLAFGNYGR